MAVSSYRPISEPEREFIVWLLEHSSTGGEKYVSQLASARVRSSCTCGCPSIAFGMPQKDAGVKLPAEIITDFTGDSEGLTVGLILFASEGVLTELEVYPFEDVKEPFGLPPLETLKPASWTNGSDSTDAQAL